MLVIVAFHPSLSEVNTLLHSLAALSSKIGFCVVANEYRVGEPIELLFNTADIVLTLSQNVGYGSAINRGVKALELPPDYIVGMNTDLSWTPGTFEGFLAWMKLNQDVALASPQILDLKGNIQYLCKTNPTFLALISRRFIPTAIKPPCLLQYDRRYVMLEHNYAEIFESEYLSGCCLIMKTEYFCAAGGFDQRYFLYLEDADITRTLSRFGRCVHVPLFTVVHAWGRGSYRSIRLMMVNIHSVYLYFKKWGIAFW